MLDNDWKVNDLLENLVCSFAGRIIFPKSVSNIAIDEAAVKALTGNKTANFMNIKFKIKVEEKS